MTTYKVVPGDTLWAISRRYGIKLNDLILVNPQIINPNLIFPNQIINIPSPTKAPSIPSAPSAPSTPSTPSGSDNIRELEKEVIRLVNSERAKAGRAALTENSDLSHVARLKSEDFVNKNYFSHNSPTYGTPFEMLRFFGIKYSAAAENIASGQKTAAEAMNTWMNSSGHRANILSSTYNQIGVGVAKDKNGKLYWTQMFVKS